MISSGAVSPGVSSSGAPGALFPAATGNRIAAAAEITTVRRIVRLPELSRDITGAWIAA